MKRIKVLYLSSGSSIHTIRWVNSLSKRSDLIVNLVSQQNLIDNLSERVIFNLLPFNGWFGYILNFFELKKIIRAWKPDLIHASYASGYGLTANLLNFHPLVLSAWGSDIFEFPRKSFIHKKLIELNLNNADVIASTSFAMAKEIKKLTRNKNIKITPFGIDTKQFKKCNSIKKNSNITLGTIKNLSEVYGIDILIKSFALARKKLLKTDISLAKRMRLKIVGSGEQKKVLLYLIRKLGISDISIIKERVKHHMVPKEMEDISIFCALSRQESFGVSILEASASGIPVITSNRGGLPEVVLNGVTGLIIEHLNPDDASEAVLKLVKDKDLRGDLGKNGIKYINEKYKWDDSINKVVKIYKSLLVI